MILKPKKKSKLKKVVFIEDLPPEKKEKKHNTLPPDEYEPMVEPMRFLVRQSDSRSTGLPFRQYLELTVKRYDDEEAKPMVWINMYQESEFYTGYLKGKSVHFPLNELSDVIGYLVGLENLCLEKHIYEED